jgi:hypothetical protein
MVDVVDDHDVYKMRRRRETCCVSWVGPGYGIVVFCVFAACLMPITGSIESSLRGLLDLVCSSARLLVCSSVLQFLILIFKTVLYRKLCEKDRQYRHKKMT